VRHADPVYETRTWTRGALPLIAMAAVQLANLQIGIVLLGSLRGPRDAGIFSVAGRASGLLAFFLLATVPTLMPTIAELRARENGVQLQRLVTRAARYVLLGSLPLAVVLLAFPGPVLAVFGHDFRGGGTALRILCLGQLVNIASGFVGTILMMVYRTGWLTLCLSVGAVANVALGAALIPGLGLTGAAIASAASLAASNIAMAVVLWRLEGIYAPALGRGPDEARRRRAAEATRASA
jgi:O-antigen/teichoic acid export membrane protein